MVYLSGLPKSTEGHAEFYIYAKMFLKCVTIQTFLLVKADVFDLKLSPLSLIPAAKVRNAALHSSYYC